MGYNRYGWTTDMIAPSLGPGTTTRDVRRLARRLHLEWMKDYDGRLMMSDDNVNALVDWATHNPKAWKRSSAREE